MSGNDKKPTLKVQLESGPVETGKHNDANAIPGDDSITTGGKRPPGAIEKLLPYGEENAISTRDLLKLSQHKTSRDLQMTIARERDAGAQILSSTRGGYYLPDKGTKGEWEVLRFVRTLDARADNTKRIAHSVKIAAGLEELEP